MIGKLLLSIAVAVILAVSANVLAEEGRLKVGGSSEFVPLTKGKPYLYVIHEGSSVKVQRIQDPNYELSGYYAKTIRKCPPFCIQPITPDPRVKVVGEVEVFNFMENELRNGKGLLIDARTPSWYQKGTIPGAINIPFTKLSKKPGSPEMDAMLKRLGAKPRGEVGFWESLLERWGFVDASYKTEKWDFTDAKELLLFCNGPACGQSPRAIRGLLAAEYPADKIHYYRGGMQLWELWGLTTVKPGESAR
jgi:rhodanese-related sulfurtransferase